MQRREGFTLIELLVVISVIALLIAIMTPALTSARKKGWQIVCQNNLRQVGIAGNMYAESNNNLIPRGLVYSTSPAWFELFMPYLSQKPSGDDYRTVKIYRCPGYPNKQQTVCYVVNGWGFNSLTDTTGYQLETPTNLTSLKRRSQSIYLTDLESGDWITIITQAKQTGIENCDIRQQSDLSYMPNGTLSTTRRVPLDRHRKGSNILYFDWSVGHLESKKITVDLFRTYK